MSEYVVNPLYWILSLQALLLVGLIALVRPVTAHLADSFTGLVGRRKSGICPLA